MWSETVYKWFTISVLINPLCDGGAAKYRRQTGSLIYSQSFYMHLLLYASITIFQISSFPEPLISTTISSCPVNFINLASTIVVFRPSEYDNKLIRDFQITISEVTLDVFKISSKN